MAIDLSSGTCRSFVRVRPYTPSEAKVCPEGSAVPRTILEWDGDETINVLDAQNNFELRRNGIFPVGNVLWSFREPDGTFPTAAHKQVATQQDVYNKVVAPMIPAIVEGYNTAFCVAGASSSGRFYTLYGKEPEGAECGILPRFADDIFAALKRNAQANSTLSVELEAIDIMGEAYVDLLAVTRRANADSQDTLKLQMTPAGPRLIGANSVDIEDATQLQKTIRQLFHIVEKRNCTHTVSLRFTETFEFEDPENFNQSVSKSRRVQVLFVLLRNMPSAFQRCIDVAVEHDSGENPLAKVPVRESAFTRLYPSLLQQGFHLNFISCVSPYYEYGREDINTLQFSMKVKQLKGRPKQSQDESLVEMRRLADELKDLKVEEKKQNAAMVVVQNELNAREVELMKQEAKYNKVANDIIESQRSVKLATVGRNLEADRSNRVRREIDKELNAKRAEIKKFQAAQTSNQTTTNKLMRDADDAKVRADAAEKKVEKQKENMAIYEQRLKEYEADDRAVEKIEAFNLAAPDEQKAMLIADSEEKKRADAAVQRIEHERASAKAFDDTDDRVRELQKEYDVAYEKTGPSREKKQLEDEIEKNQKEIDDAEKEMRQLQADIDEKKSQCQCSLM
ncbi:putative mitochondrial kinesin-like protein [Leptomonas pyrrhocoris]|uniref:Putative mitochondrial kinesin-like protein n=1 Tax=Leptomonas pyrrhocoris TaxID=157538 RepID=A0A0M9G3W2_LEPPY|nr:putative mitochondrial kinesin-like protein [Leptomonas pyrrhocoris]XP_015660034.1 putative mitochondrial kinesin-like protein [Leptomonas pyrrhocoris]XP_015660035.1 putative mitochondrial kinesin-like protein [Leptomonas pyrrhocoris]KPA81594.1 putative mitochondrial kinesin-like protein [Leptomonas pyrrhocoris]KPA81595.1 putative mitochondrial kinesin-like protein [Leptomonas pyrrhocoris]KPA81596.1 putative mitochondrial kinesin-like protein [Leptomonas pyrrhocoris]|eukprot:XP_015660033.1 putative mitochondrial kinesin-like protein [Leptomonas pyrrhocoris]